MATLLLLNGLLKLLTRIELFGRILDVLLLPLSIAVCFCFYRFILLKLMTVALFLT